MAIGTSGYIEGVHTKVGPVAPMDNTWGQIAGVASLVGSIAKFSNTMSTAEDAKQVSTAKTVAADAKGRISILPEHQQLDAYHKEVEKIGNEMKPKWGEAAFKEFSDQMTPAFYSIQKASLLKQDIKDLGVSADMTLHTLKQPGSTSQNLAGTVSSLQEVYPRLTKPQIAEAVAKRFKTDAYTTIQESTFTSTKELLAVEGKILKNLSKLESPFFLNNEGESSVDYFQGIKSDIKAELANMKTQFANEHSSVIAMATNSYKSMNDVFAPSTVEDSFKQLSSLGQNTTTQRIAYNAARQEYTAYKKNVDTYLNPTILADTYVPSHVRDSSTEFKEIHKSTVLSEFGKAVQQQDVNRALKLVNKHGVVFKDMQNEVEAEFNGIALNTDDLVGGEQTVNKYKNALQQFRQYGPSGLKVAEKMWGEDVVKRVRLISALDQINVMPGFVADKDFPKNATLRNYSIVNMIIAGEVPNKLSGKDMGDIGALVGKLPLKQRQEAMQVAVGVASIAGNPIEAAKKVITNYKDSEVRINGSLGNSLGGTKINDMYGGIEWSKYNQTLMDDKLGSLQSTYFPNSPNVDITVDSYGKIQMMDSELGIFSPVKTIILPDFIKETQSPEAYETYREDNPYEVKVSEVINTIDSTLVKFMERSPGITPMGMAKDLPYTLYQGIMELKEDLGFLFDEDTLDLSTEPKAKIKHIVETMKDNGVYTEMDTEIPEEVYLDLEVETTDVPTYLQDVQEVTNEELIDINILKGTDDSGMALGQIKTTTPEGAVLPEGYIRLGSTYYKVRQ